MRRTRKQTWLAVVFAWLLLVVPAAAQPAPATLERLEVALWPEYDRAEMLVIYRGTLAAETALPVAMEIRIPASAGQPSAVAFVDAAGERLNQEYTTRTEGEWLVVAFLLNAAGFQLEYYDPLAVDAAGRREYTFDYTAAYAVEALSLQVQVPTTAEGFTIEPAAVSKLEQIEGLSYHLIEAGALAQGETRSWTVTYQKGDTALSQEALPAAGSTGGAAPEGAAAEGQAEQPGRSESGSTLLIFAIAFVALVAVGAGAFWLGRQTQAPGGPGNHDPKRQRALFCRQCGSELRADAEFCHRCGTAVRK